MTRAANNSLNAGLEAIEKSMFGTSPDLNSRSHETIARAQYDDEQGKMKAPVSGTCACFFFEGQRRRQELSDSESVLE